ncbi:hypothetical protein [Kitasatospora sp. NPDC088783]|uniref:hypothetical protein n=1 Tax=Kitasatospora sp. NPDC088783 TaxID=3364077 RepID=UPI003825911C
MTDSIQRAGIRELVPGPEEQADLVSFRQFASDPANHAPRTAPARRPAAPTADPAGAAPPVIDETTGRVRVMGGQCTTCIGRRGNPAGLDPERLGQLAGCQGDGTFDEGHTVCHKTLPGNPDDLPAAVCAWFASHAQAGPRSLVMRLAASRGVIEVHEPNPIRR